MSFLTYQPKRKVLLFFQRNDDAWYFKFLSGYTHVAIGYVQDDIVAITEPIFTGTLSYITLVPEDRGMWGHLDILELDIVQTCDSKLVRPVFQTCATICQYLAGIRLGAILPQTLYSRLTQKSEAWLVAHGITGVKKWGHSRCH